MKFNTTRFGEIDINLEESLLFPSGLIGFPELKRFILLNTGNQSPFKWLQSLDDGAIAFVLVNPLLFKPDYLVEVSDTEIQDIQIENEEATAISVIVTMPNNPKDMTANLKAPIIFNVENRKAKQVILNNPQYSTKHLIETEIRKASEVAADISDNTAELINKIREDSKASSKKVSGIE